MIKSTKGDDLHGDLTISAETEMYANNFAVLCTVLGIVNVICTAQYAWLPQHATWDLMMLQSRMKTPNCLEKQDRVR